DDKGWDARKRAYCLKIQPATGSFARNLIYSTKPFNCSVLTKAWMFNIRLYRVNFDEASVQGMGITILRGEENISINSDILVTLQKFFEEDCATHTGMSQTEDNLHAVAMKITADIMQDAD
ncbi:pentapeptide repeat-containing protein, partial [Escherichia coli]